METTQGAGDESLERALEKQMMEDLKQQNELLKNQVETLKQSIMSAGSTGSWSEVSQQVFTPAPPPPPLTPTRETPMMTPMSPSCLDRFTPNGTKIPPGPPPKTPELPKWPESLTDYQLMELGRRLPALRDDRPWQPRCEDGRDGGVRGFWECGGGAQSRQGEVQGFCEPGGGAQSRQAEVHGGQRGPLLHGQVQGHGNYASPTVGSVIFADQGVLQGQVRPSGYGNMSPKPPPLPNLPTTSGCQGAHQHQGMIQQCHQMSSYRNGIMSHEAELMRLQEEEEIRKRYWQRPERFIPPGSSATGPAAAEIMKEVLDDYRSRTYTQAEVEELLQQARQKRARSEDRNHHEDRRSDEGLRSFPVTLPVLPEPQVKNASLEAGDWLTQVQPLIADVSGSASAWWNRLVQATTQQYHKWLSANPMDKLKIEPPDHGELARGNERLAQRIGVMMMQALPQGLRQELIAARQMEATHILYKIYKTYQPGGLAERRQMLAQLTDTQPAQTPAQAVASLRHWKRQAQRAVELQATMPDPVLQVRALTVIMDTILARNSQSSFRVSSYRMTHGIDVAPSNQDINQFYDLLLSEAEYLVMSDGECLQQPNELSDSTMPQVKALHQGSPNKPKTAVCKFWGTDHGCKHGRGCQFQHDWQGLQDKGDRCWVCSAKGHRKAECQAPRGKDEQVPSPPGGSVTGEGSGKQQDGQGKGQGKTKDKKGSHKGGGKGGKKEAGKAEAEVKVEQDQQPAVKAEKVAVKEEAPLPSSGTNGQEALVSEVTSLLRSIRVQGDPQVRKLSVNRLQAKDQGGHTLIDGGATHCMRTARSEAEWEEANPVMVKLAAGEMGMRQHPATTTLLVKEQVQSIAPVAKIVECGYSVHWDRESCKIEHLKYGKVKVEMDQGCPTVNEEWGERLMREVEAMELRKCKVRAIMQCGALAEDTYEKQIAELQSLFPQVPLRILERIPGERDWGPVQLPINRRKRRQIDQASAVIINMCSGPDRKRWRTVEGNGVVVLNLDLELGINVMDPHVSGWLESVISTGKVIMWTAGPPCRTVSLCRQRGLQDGGPKPLRLREGPQRFGIHNLTGAQQDLADHDAALWLKNLWYMRQVKRQRPDAELLLEQPQDPEEWASWAPDCPSFLVWPETRQLVSDLELCEVRVNQGKMGHATKKPTTLITDVPEVKQLEMAATTVQETKASWPDQLQDRMVLSKQLAQWAPGLVEVLKIAMRRKINSNPSLKALNAKEKDAKQAWQLHRDLNHLPYRRDCAICVETMGQDRPHRRQRAPEAFTLSLDVAGPFIEGLDQMDYHKPKYFVVATMTVPMFGDKPMVEGLRKLAGDSAALDGLPQPPEEPEALEDDSKPGEKPEDPFEPQEPSRKDRDVPLTEAQVKQLDAQDQKWREFIAETENRPVKTFSMAVPTKSKQAQDVVRATAQVVARLRSLQIPINRIHTDRGTEFCSKIFRDWVNHRDFHTTTAGDDAAANARAESEIKVLKSRARVLMKSAKCELNKWPLAIRYASEERFRRQLRECGVPAPQMLPFGIKAYARQKSWQNRYESWRSPMVPVQVWGPACDMSMTSKGYFLEITETGQMMRSTVVVVPKGGLAIGDMELEQPNQSSDQVAMGDVEPHPEAPLPDVESVAYSPSVAGDEDGGDMAPDNLQLEDQVELELHPAGPGDEAMPSHDPPRRGLTGKQPGRPHQREQEPILRKIGGESHYDDGLSHDEKANTRCQTVGAVAQARRPGDNIHNQNEVITEFHDRRDQERLEDLMVYEHAGLTSWTRSERQLASEPAAFNALRKAEEAAEELEGQLQAMARIRKLEVEGMVNEEEILQTRVIPMDEVKNDLEGWKPAFQKEYEALVGGPVQAITLEDVQAMEKSGAKVEVLPAKAIASKKPPNKRKGRIVVCGNYASEKDSQDVSVGGVCAMAVRGVVHTAACDQLALGSIDVSGAFLQAPRRQTDVVTVVQPPRLLQQLGIITSQERWKVLCALYGMVESPADWAVYRDGRMECMTWNWNGSKYWLERTPEQHLWKVKRQLDDQVETAGWIAVYVDDFLVAMKEDEIQGAFREIKATWRCSEEEMVNAQKSMRFCGYEIRKTETGGYFIKQEGYVRDLLEKYQITGCEGQPLPKIEDEEDECEPELQDIRSAQTVVGELQWIAQRSRPDVAYAIGLLARLIHRRPKWVNRMSSYLLKYLNGTAALGLRYEKIENEDQGEIRVLADTSFGPPHEKFRSVQAVIVEHGRNVLAWESSRQSFVTQSTAEAELIGYNEGLQLGESTAALLEVLERNVNKRLQGDCKAALAQVLGDTGPWRTRHLRLRSAKLREALRDPLMRWSAEHKPGADLAADGLTKALQSKAFDHFVQLLRMEHCTDHDPVGPKVAAVQVKPPMHVNYAVASACVAVGAAMLDTNLAVASLILLAGFLLRVVVGKGMRSQQDPQKDRFRTLQKELKKRSEEGTPYGFDQSGLVPLNAGAGILHLGSDPRDQLGVGSLGKIPGIRAIRRSGGSHGSPNATDSAARESSARGSSAAARGRDAMGWHQQRAAASEGYPLAPAQESAERVDIEEIRDMLRRLDIQSERDSLRGDWREPGSQAASSSTAARTTVTENDHFDQPWRRPEFRSINRASKDKWDLQWQKHGWVIREHHKERVQRFHPIHSSTPFDAACIESRRITVQTSPTWEVIEDMWTVPCKVKAAAWKGYTFFKLTQQQVDNGFELVDFDET